MIKLEEKNIPDYLKSINVFKDVNWQNVRVNEVKEHTNVNFVFAVALNSRQYKKVYLKQAFDFVKVAPDFPAPIERQEYEERTIDYLQKYWPGRIPEVIHYDEENNTLIITDVGQNARLLADEIKQGRLHLDIGPDLGSMMAELHAPTYKQNVYPVRDKKANDKHVDFIFDFRLRGSREVLPRETNKLFQASQKAKSSVIYGDWASKNVFVAKKKVKLVDFENLVRFDPAFDIGYALAHWVLEISQDNRPKISRFFREFESSYKKKWSACLQKDVDAILKRASKYTGAMMLHRLAGIKNTNRLDEYLAREVTLIEAAKRHLQGDYSSPSAATRLISLTDEEFGRKK